MGTGNLICFASKSHRQAPYNPNSNPLPSHFPSLPPTTTKGKSSVIKMAAVLQRPTAQFSNPGRIESNMMNELLLVVSVLGSHVSEEDKEGRISERFVPVADCLNWLQDLQRALRSDKDDLRPIANQLGTWKVVEEKLIPIALVKRDDPDTILTLAKLFVILTKPMTKAAKQAALINIDVKSKKFSEETIQDQVSLKVSAIKAVRLLALANRRIPNPPLAPSSMCLIVASKGKRPSSVQVLDGVQAPLSQGGSSRGFRGPDAGPALENGAKERRQGQQHHRAGITLDPQPSLC